MEKKKKLRQRKRPMTKNRTNDPKIIHEILSRSVMGFVDKYWVMKEYNFAKRTVEYLLTKLDLRHRSQKTINIIEDYLNGSTIPEITKKYNYSSERVVYDILELTRDEIGYKKTFKNGFFIDYDTNKLKMERKK
jgi:Mor family transcriptional regulator